MKKRMFLLLLLLLFLFVGCNNTTDTITLPTGNTTTELITGLPGEDGREVMFQVTSDYIQWKYSDGTVWNNLIPISSLIGETGQGISSLVVNDLGELVVTYTDYSVVNLGEVLKLNLVQFTDNMGKVISVQLVRDNEAAIAPMPPLVDGLVFNHWGEDFSNVTEDLIVHAYYLPIAYTLTFDAQGGTPVEGMTYYYGQPINLPVPVKNGYRFLGWFLGNDTNSRQIYSYDTITSDITVYARWQSSNAITVYNEDDFLEAISDFSYQEIYFGADITIYDYVEINHPLTIFGNGYKLESKNIYNIFTISPIYYDYSYSDSYPNGGYLTINDLSIIADHDIEDYYSNTLINIYAINNFNLNLNNVKLQGSVESAIDISSSENITVLINDSDIDVAYFPVSLVASTQINIRMNRTDLSAAFSFFVAYVEESQLTMSDSKINLTDAMIVDSEEAEELTAFIVFGSSNNEFQFNNTLFTTESDLPSNIVEERFGGYQGFVFFGCTFEVNNPVFEELFYSESGYTYFDFYDSTIIIKEGITEIPESGFANVYGISNYILPESLITIGNYAFDNNFYLNSIVIPENVTTIGDYAFYGCDLLFSIVIPASVTNVGAYAFGSVQEGSIIYLMQGVDQTDWNINWNPNNQPVISTLVHVGNLDGIVYLAFTNNTIFIIDFIYQGTADIVIPNSITIDDVDYTFTKILPFAFSYSANIQSIYIPNTVDYIGDSAFEEATKLKTVTFEENSTLEFIGSGAFSYCYNLRSIFIPASVNYLGDGAFYGNEKLAEVIFEPGINLIEISTSAFAGNSSLREIVIPASVEAIASSAFQSNMSLQSVSFEDGSLLSYIGAYAFQSNSNLKEFNLPATVTFIGQYAFEYNYNLESFNISQDSVLEHIGNYAFSNNQKLASIYLPDSITYIGRGAFQHCYALTSVTLPLGITEINWSTFQSATNLETVIFPEGSQITSIGNFAFSNTKIQTIDLPDTVTSIGQSAFSSCISLTSIHIPAGVTVIEHSTFYAAINLQRITFGNIDNLTTINESAFEATLSLGTFFIPSSVHTVYQNAFRNSNITIYAEAAAKPETWSIYWDTGINTVFWNANYLVLEPNNGDETIIIYAVVGDAITAPADPVRKGFVFDGWYTDDGTFLDQYTFTTMTSADVIVYAKWIPES